MLEEKLSKLREEIIDYSQLITTMFNDAVKFIFSYDEAGLLDIIKNKECKANEFEVDIEEKCVYIIAQYEPRAVDLRFILCVLKMNNDFERIADHVVNISQSGVFLIKNDKDIISLYKTDIEQMFNLSYRMLTESISAFKEQNSQLAKSLCELDQEVDNFKAQVYKKIIQEIKTNPKNIEVYLHLERIINNIERIADLTTNICEDIIFLYEAKIIKHHKEEYL